MRSLISWLAHSLLPSSPGPCMGCWSRLPSVCPGGPAAQAASMWRPGRLPGDTVALLTAELVINHRCCMSHSVPLTSSLEKGRWYSPFFRVVERSRRSGTVTHLRCYRQSKEDPGQGAGVWAPVCLSLPWDLGGHRSAHRGHSGSSFIRAQRWAPAVISLRPGRHQGSIVGTPVKALGPLGSGSSVEYLREPQSR